MTEAFLHYLWQFRLYNPQDLTTTDGTRVAVVKPGQHNSDAGPDFFNAHIRLDNTLWAGNVEIHIHASDWQRHSHHLDDAYDGCILHVVLDADAPAMRKDGSIIPTLSLRQRIPEYLWANYIQLLQQRNWVACEKNLHEIDSVTIQVLMDRMSVERLEYKTAQISKTLELNQGDWEETFYLQLARNFGFHVNAAPFEVMARSLPYRLIRQYKEHLLRVEALMFGQAGMLNKEFTELYPQQLQEEYRHLARLHRLKPIQAATWKFLRLRPNNFPTIRLAQFAALLFQHENIFSRLMEARDLETLYSFFQLNSSAYWQNHFMFDKPSIETQKKPGQKSIENILINTVVPFLFAWGTKNGNEDHRRRALEFLEKIPPENNQIMRKWAECGIPAQSALHSQALLHLKVHACDEKLCLTCSIGSKVINSLP